MVKTPLTLLAHLRPKALEKVHFITDKEIAPISIEKRLLGVGVMLIREREELLQDDVSTKLQLDIFKYVLKSIKENSYSLIAYEYNHAVKAMKRHTEVEYKCWNGTVSGLILVKYYLEEFGTENTKPLLKQVNKQLDYIENGTSHEVYRDSVVYAENVRRYYYDAFESSKTVEEIEISRQKFFDRFKKTMFSFINNERELEEHQEAGVHFTLDESVNKWMTGYQKSEFGSFNDKYFMKKHKITLLHSQYE